MRKSCYECVRKHLGSAGVFVKETKMGYPNYDIWVIGELEHAADECLEANRDLAMAIREHRLAWTEDKNHKIPFEALNVYVKDCMLAEEADMQPPVLTEEILQGITGENGELSVHGDTRP
jgi:hypothetical protein